MSQQSGLTPSEHLRTYGRVHIVGAEPVGLFLTALLQPMEGFSVRLYEKRPEYTRTRMVKLAPYLRPARYCMGLSRAFTSLRFPHWPGRGGESISRDVAQKLGFGYLNKAIVVSITGSLSDTPVLVDGVLLNCELSLSVGHYHYQPVQQERSSAARLGLREVGGHRLDH
jgi:hypothetical protein